VQYGLNLAGHVTLRTSSTAQMFVSPSSENFVQRRVDNRRSLYLMHAVPNTVWNATAATHDVHDSTLCVACQNRSQFIGNADF
jgi:hypothetical protein